jgi:hypothetical protein
MSVLFEKTGSYTAGLYLAEALMVLAANCIFLMPAYRYPPTLNATKTG